MYVLSDGRRCAGHSGETGEGFAEMARGDTPQNTKSGYSVPFLIGIPKQSGMQCIKTFAPKLKALVLFYSDEAERYRSILYVVKNDGAYKGCRESR